MPDKFNISKRGYAISEVDDYIETLESVLRSYKEKDAAIKNALINAQIAADNIIKNAELAAEDIRSNAMAQIKNISNSVGHQRKVIKEFQQAYNALIDRYVQKYNETDIMELYKKISELEEYLGSLQDKKATPLPVDTSSILAKPVDNTTTPAAQAEEENPAALLYGNDK